MTAGELADSIRERINALPEDAVSMELDLKVVKGALLPILDACGGALTGNQDDD